MNLNLVMDLVQRGLTKCECPACDCQTPVVAQIQDSLCFECREPAHPTDLELEETACS